MGEQLRRVTGWARPVLVVSAVIWLMCGMPGCGSSSYSGGDCDTGAYGMTRCSDAP